VPSGWWVVPGNATAGNTAVWGDDQTQEVIHVAHENIRRGRTLAGRPSRAPGKTEGSHAQAWSTRRNFLETTERDDRLPPLSRRLRVGFLLLGRGTPDSVAADSALVDADREPFALGAADVSREAYAESIFIKSGLRNRRRLVPKPEPGVESLPKTLRVFPGLRVKTAVLSGLLRAFSGILAGSTTVRSRHRVAARESPAAAIAT
jgi:hypothetical protein